MVRSDVVVQKLKNDNVMDTVSSKVSSKLFTNFSSCNSSSLSYLSSFRFPSHMSDVTAIRFMDSCCKRHIETQTPRLMVVSSSHFKTGDNSKKII